MKVKYSRLLMWLLVFSPILDNITGYMLLLNNNSDFSLIYKGVILGCCALILLQVASPKKISYLVLLIAFLGIQLAFFEFGNSGSLSYNFSITVKLFTPILIITTFKVLSMYDRTVLANLNFLVKFYMWFFPMSLLIPMLLGIGYNTYSNGVGNKGLYFAGNEISAIMIIVLIFQIDNYKKEKSKRNFICLILGIVSALSIGTKAVYIALIILVVVALYSNTSLNKKVLILVLGVPIITAGVTYSIKNIVLLQEVYQAWKWKFNNMYNSVIGFMLSGRDMKFDRVLNIVDSDFDIFKLIFGYGPNYIVNEKGCLIEMDFFDLLIWFGIIIFIVVLRMYFRYIRLAVTKKNSIYITGVILIFGSSIISGHILFAPMVGIVLATLCLKIELESDEGKRVKRKNA